MGTRVDPQPGRRVRASNVLLGLTCVAANDCWAVGRDGTSNSNEILRWDGSAWALVSASTGMTSGELSSVACAKASRCLAVGSYESTTTFAQLDEALRWDGSSWSSVLVPSPGKHYKKDNNGLNHIACTSGKDCWAVGDYHFNHNQAVQWNGSTWAEAHVPDPATPSKVTSSG